MGLTDGRPLFGKFVAIAEVAGIPQSGHDIGHVVEHGVDGGNPERHIVGGEKLFETLHALFATDDGTDVEFSGCAFRQVGLIGQIERATGGQHRVDQHKSATIEAGRGDVFNAHLNIFLAPLLAIGTHKGTVGIVEDVQKTFVEGKAGTQDGADDDTVVDGVGFGLGKRSLHHLAAVLQGTRHFIGHGVADAAEVLTKPGAILLNVDVAEFGNVVVDDAVVFGEIDYFHRLIGVVQVYK